MSNKVFHHENWKRLISEERKIFMPADTLLSHLPLNKKQIWADIGCGPGFFTLPLAKIVNKVLAIDISDEMLAILKTRLKENHITNVDMIKSDCELPENTPILDGILLINVLHEFEQPDRCLSSYKKYLKREGLLVIVDWHAKQMEKGPPLHHRIPENEMIKLVSENGFLFESSLNIYELHYVLLFKPS